MGDMDYWLSMDIMRPETVSTTSTQWIVCHLGRHRLLIDIFDFSFMGQAQIEQVNFSKGSWDMEI